MKTLNKITSIAMMSAVIAFGAVAGSAQNPCDDNDTKSKLYDEFNANRTGDEAARLKAIAAGEQYLEKFSSCEADKQYIDYFKGALPKMKERIENDRLAREKQQRYQRFDSAVKAKNFDEVYRVGKEILQFEPEQLDLMLTLGSIGYDESIDNNNFKFNDDTLKFARMALAAMESGKTSTNYGLFGWTYKTRENAIGEMNLSIGYITAVPNKNRKDALGNLFRSTNSAAATSKNPVPYEQIGLYYFDEMKRMIDEIKTLEGEQKDTDTEEVSKQRVDTIKAKVALLNGVAERAMDAFARAHNLATAAAYKSQMKKNVEQAYQLRFDKTTGMDAWMSAALTRPFPNPMTPVTPVNDPTPAGSVAGSTPNIEPAAAAPAKPDSNGAKPAAKTKVPTKARRRA